MRMTFLPTLFFLVLVAVAVPCGTPAFAGTFTYAISVENYIDSYNYNSNYNMFAGSGSSMKLVVNGSNSARKAIP